MTSPLRSDRHGETPDHVECFRVHRDRCGRQLEGICSFRAHHLGWELVLNVNGSLQRSEVCRSQDDLLDTCERWRAAMIEQGWH